jgi:hypothetical protein
MIQMISGAYCAKNVLIRPRDGAFSLSAEEEERLVKRGVAKYVNQSASVDEVTIPVYDVGMTRKQLEGIAAYYKLEIGKSWTKQDIVNALDELLRSQGQDSEEADVEQNTEESIGDEDSGQPNLGADIPEL